MDKTVTLKDKSEKKQLFDVDFSLKFTLIRPIAKYSAEP